MRSLKAFAVLLCSGLMTSEALADVDLGLPTEPKSSVEMPTGKQPIFGARLYAPPGRERHPALVMSHTCAGTGLHVFEWARRALAAGYVALIVDHLGPRHRTFNCPPGNPISVTEFAQDDVAALNHLRVLPFVDGSRIGQMGWSYGAMAGLRLASASFRKRYVGGETFRAIVAMYPWCNDRVGQGGDHQYNFNDDTDVPLFLVLGADDDEAPPKSCVEQAKANKARGLPVEWKLYPNTTHGFDFSNLGDKPLTIRRPGAGETVTYRYNAAAVEDAWALSRAFYARSFASTR